MSRRLPGGPVEVVKPLGIVATSRRRGLRVAVVVQGGREAIELRAVSLSPAANVVPGSHRSTIPLDAVDAVVALLASAKRGEGR